ncbi:carbamoyltransferase HypF [Methylocystis sp. SC2]|uniref:carbamoyltransferase HypF n=1 Tax=Methylocystis sp. (strain SC2) TaxID=187303 RepID=UPI00027AF091|nr:carbamoyltransferase HypF [Methylocystis sp. SC2]CCJ08873.1 (NiFe) hydrogenase maturation protein HypF [Methylocystis sp. SC2]
MSFAAVEPSQALEFRVRGRVQGVGFRPTVWRMARELGLAGEVLNDAEGVLVRVSGDQSRIAALLRRIERSPPPLAHIDSIERRHYSGHLPLDFRIAESVGGAARTQVAPDAALCAACAAELRDPRQRRYRYPFTNCTHCGPRLSIVTAIPYDRATTTMAPFALCAACEAEYRNPNDRRFHAEAVACPSCGPNAALVAFGRAEAPRDRDADAVEIAARLIAQGEIIAVKGLGGYHLACDATRPETVARLRLMKRRDAKPFALMARDLDVVRCYCAIDPVEERALTSVEAPIMLLRATGPERLPEAVAPGLDTLGFMLPTTPLHLLLIDRFECPLVMTSGNISDEPAVVDDSEAYRQLAEIASFALTHHRGIANRVDDSVVRVMGGRSRVLRRARGYAPAPLRLPKGFEDAPELLAMGGELKSTFCLVKDGQAILSQHQGDLEKAATIDDYKKNLALYRSLFDHRPSAIVIDRHPDYLSSKLGCAEAERRGALLIEVQHHHAHVAACLAENLRPLDAPAVLGIVLDGLGLGDDGAIWGGEFLLADYLGYERLARLKPVAMPGGAQAVREPWRNLYAHFKAAGEFDATPFAPGDWGALNGKPLATIDRMIAQGVNSPSASSCGRLFDAVAAALGVCADRQAYEGEAAARLEALAAAAPKTTRGYALRINESELIDIDAAPMWRAIRDDLQQSVSAPTIARRFHLGLAQSITEVAVRLAAARHFSTVALSGGCFQNRLLFESVQDRLRDAGFVVLSHADTPSNDGGLSLGQAAIGAAYLMRTDMTRDGKDGACVSAFPAASSA